MKKYIALLALAGLATTAMGEGADFSHSAEFRLRYTLEQEPDGNEDANPSSQNRWDQRLRWGSTFRAGEKLTAHLGLIHSAMWGHSDFLTGSTSDSGDPAIGQMTGVGNGENLLLVNEAYGSWMATDELLIRFGRGGLPMGDERVIGLNNWGSTQNAFEGALFTYDKEMARFNVFGAKVADWNVSATPGNTKASDPEINMWGFSMDWKSLPEWLKMAHLHVLQVNIDKNADATTTLPGPFATVNKESKMRYGIVLSGDTHNIDYRLTYAAHNGEWEDLNLDREGSMIDAEVGYSMANFMNSRVSFLYHTDTGDDTGSSGSVETYDSFYYTKHDKAGWMDVYEYGNLTFMQVGWSMDLTEDLSLKAQYLMFSQTEKDSSTKTSSFGGTWAVQSDATEDDLGSEIDVELTKKYQGGLMITGRLGMFSPGDEYKGGAEDSYNQFMLEGKMSF